jgi:ribosome-binding protein aMBF1 (putative translation factor)
MDTKKMTPTTLPTTLEKLQDIGTGVMLHPLQEQYPVAMRPGFLKITPSSPKTTLIRNVLPASHSLDYVVHAELRIFVQVIQDPSTFQLTPRQWLAKRTKWRNCEYRRAYMEAAIEQGVAWQIKINRERRGLSQKELAKRIASTQSAVSRAEDPSYGRHRLETLVKVANAFDCALHVSFVPYSRLAKESDDLSPDTLYAKSYTEEIE